MPESKDEYEFRRRMKCERIKLSQTQLPESKPKPKSPLMKTPDLADPKYGRVGK